jgi:hypothetical protein
MSIPRPKPPMLNTAPIFVIGFQRGGTNILTNLIASHPDVCALGRETHQVFYGRHNQGVGKWIDRLWYVPILVAARAHVFRPASLRERNGLPRPAMRYADWLLHRSKVATSCEMADSEPGATRSHERRLLAKNVNGLALATSLLGRIYPDATFVALVRNGLALCESYVRRGWTADAFGTTYERICDRMLQDAGTRQDYHIVRFEEMIADPAAVIAKVYGYASLDVRRVAKFRLQAKQSMDRDGRRNYTFGGEQDRETRWFGLGDLGGCFRKDVDENQIARLADRDRQTFLQRAGRSMARLGYV